MRPFLRIARGRAVPIAPNLLLPRCCCARQSLHTLSPLRLPEEEKTRGRTIHAPEEDLSVERAESEAHQSREIALLEDADAAVVPSEEMSAADVVDEFENEGPLMITEEVAKVLAAPWQKKMKDQAWAKALQKAKKRRMPRPARPVERVYKPPSLSSFTMAPIPEEDEKIRAITRRAVIEVYTHMLRPHHPREPVSFPFGFKGEEHETTKVKVTKDVVAGQLKFDYGSGKVLKAVGKGWPTDRSSGDSGEASAVAVGVVAEDDAWTEIPISDMALKFAVIKRSMQLCGFRLPDYCLQTISTAGDLAAALVTHRPGALTAYGRKPKLADQLSNTDLPAGAVLSELQNVKILKRRILRTDREIALGRLVTIPLITKKHVETLEPIPPLEEDVRAS